MKYDSSHRKFLNISSIYILYTSLPSHWIPGGRTRKETQASCPLVQSAFKIFWTVMEDKTKKYHRSRTAQYLLLSKYRIGSLGNKQNKVKLCMQGDLVSSLYPYPSDFHHAYTVVVEIRKEFQVDSDFHIPLRADSNLALLCSLREGKRKIHLKRTVKVVVFQWGQNLFVRD